MDPVHSMLNSDLVMSQTSEPLADQELAISNSVASLQICSDQENNDLNRQEDDSEEDFEHVSYEETKEGATEEIGVEAGEVAEESELVENVIQNVELAQREGQATVETISMIQEQEKVEHTTEAAYENASEKAPEPSEPERDHEDDARTLEMSFISTLSANPEHEALVDHEVASQCESFDQISSRLSVSNRTEYTSATSYHEELMGESNRIESYYDDDMTSVGSTLPADWHEDVVNKLIDIFGEEDALPIITYLSMCQEHRDHLASGVWKMLHSLLTKDEVFKKYVEESILPHASQYIESETIIHDLSLVAGPLPELEDLQDPTQINHFHWTRGAVVAFFRTLPEMPLSVQSAILRRMFISAQTSEGILAALRVSSTSAVAVLSLAGFALEAGYILLWRWLWQKNIKGVEVAKRLVNALLATAAATGGGLAGASIGALAGPVGAIVGGIVGGVAGAISENLLFHKLYKWVFAQTRHRALKQAYDYLQVAPHASNAAINGAYMGLLKTYHPDKGGKPEDYHKLVTSYLLIKASREPNLDQDQN